MALTLDRTIGNYHDSSHGRLRKIGKLTGPASYTAGGEALTAATLGLGTIELLTIVPFWDGSTLHLGVYDYANATLLIVNPTTGAEVGAGTDLSAFTGRFEAIGL